MHGQSRPYRYLSDMPERACTALLRCHTDVVLVGNHADKGISTRTINVLTTRQLIIEGRDKRARRVWKPSHTGLVLISTEEPRFLAQQSQKGYTTNPALALVGEPECVDAAWTQRLADEAHSQDASRMSERSIGWEWERALQAAEAAGVDVTRQRLAIQKQIRAVQRKAQQRAA